MAETHLQEEHLDVLTKTGQKTGVSKPRHNSPFLIILLHELSVELGDVHRDGDYHRAVHVWIFAESTQELLLQRRADCKDSWPGLWDISSAGHISAGDSSLITAQRELHEELGVNLPKDAFELIFVFLQECVINDGTFINNEYNDVYLITTLDPIPLEAFMLQETEVSAVKYIAYEEYRSLLAKEDPDYVPYDIDGQYSQLFDIITQRYKENTMERSLSLQKKLRRYAPVTLSAELPGLSDADKEALGLLIKAATVMDEIFHWQVWYSNPVLRYWLKKQSDSSELDKLKWMYYLINKSPWSCLDENEAFLTTADSAVKFLPHATKPVTGWKGLEYKAAFPMLKPPGANFYPPDMDKMVLDEKAAELLHKAGDVASSHSLKRLLHSKADAFLSNDYYESDIAWMELLGAFIVHVLNLLVIDIKWTLSLDVTIGPYETYEDTIFGYKVKVFCNAPTLIAA
ncbi:hypothetical protein Patl1_34830 [Pistacia atlantica]|uniref:Uncharacterized protein n=1 Tax=Pistacia atlantica TaxID=434234 RepID=A0ACC0ZNM9_9ROSI|nr:hypothetical protein Patl1_34830 [Pistacia atlantica]